MSDQKTTLTSLERMVLLGIRMAGQVAPKYAAVAEMLIARGLVERVTRLELTDAGEDAVDAE